MVRGFTIRKNQETGLYDVYKSNVPKFPRKWTDDNPSQETIDKYRVLCDYDTIAGANIGIKKYLEPIHADEIEEIEQWLNE